MKSDFEPVGHDFEAVVTFKEYCDKKDEFYVYKVNDKRWNADLPSFVFKSSKQKAKIATQMDKNGDHFLKGEYCFFDGKCKRCRGFVTLTSSVYHPLLRKQLVRIPRILRYFGLSSTRSFKNTREIKITNSTQPDSALIWLVQISQVLQKSLAMK